VVELARVRGLDDFRLDTLVERAWGLKAALPCNPWCLPAW
jgi:hypothetical protein